MKPAIALLALLLASPALADDPKPNPVLTPGAWRSPPTPLAQMCAVGFTAKARRVTDAAKVRVYRSYHIDPFGAAARGFRIDHLVPLGLDGTNEDRNLWPELGSTKKDVLEGRLHKLVCTGAVPLAEAQRAIATDWPAAYARYVTVNPK